MPRIEPIWLYTEASAALRSLRPSSFLHALSEVTLHAAITGGGALLTRDVFSSSISPPR